MVYRIVAELCTSCGACELDCPNEAISMDRFTYVIDPAKCTECEGVPRFAPLRLGLPGSRHLRAATVGRPGQS